MIKLLKFLFCVVFILLVVAIISPLKAIYIINILACYTWTGFQTAGSFIIELAIKIRSL